MCGKTDEEECKERKVRDDKTRSIATGMLVMEGYDKEEAEEEESGFRAATAEFDDSGNEAETVVCPEHLNLKAEDLRMYEGRCDRCR